MGDCWLVSCSQYFRHRIWVYHYFDDVWHTGSRLADSVRTEGRWAWKCGVRLDGSATWSSRQFMRPVLYRKDVISVLQNQVPLASDGDIIVLPKVLWLYANSQIIWWIPNGSSQLTKFWKGIRWCKADSRLPERITNITGQEVPWDLCSQIRTRPLQS